MVRRGGGTIYSPQEFAQVLTHIIGKRTTNQFSKDTGVDGGYISRMLRMKLENPPGAGVISRLAQNSAPGMFERLMYHAGYSLTTSPLQSSDDTDWLQEIAAAPKEKQQLIRQLWEMIREL